MPQQSWTRTLRPAALALLVALPAVCAHAARWYEVELLVFAREDPAAAGAEQWDPLPRLDYPPTARFLVDPARMAANSAAHAGDSRIDPFGRQIITIASDHPVTAPAPIVTPAAPESAAAPGAAPGAGTAPPRETPTPFLVLPADRRALNAAAARMQRSGRFSVLFHQAWVQPIGSARSSLPVVIDDSGNSGQWPRLQGSIRLYSSRYLYLETDLWLNTDGSYLPGQWRMDPPPLGPPSLVIDEPFPEPAARVESTVGPPAAAGDAAERAAPSAEPDDTAPAADTPGAGDATAAGPPIPVSPWRHAVLLQQKRRMRSAEVNYLDHPLFGVLIQVTPLDPAELQALASRESDQAP